jgi:hypothetical protein
MSGLFGLGQVKCGYFRLNSFCKLVQVRLF